MTAEGSPVSTVWPYTTPILIPPVREAGRRLQIGDWMYSVINFEWTDWNTNWGTWIANSIAACKIYGSHNGQPGMVFSPTSWDTVNTLWSTLKLNVTVVRRHGTDMELPHAVQHHCA